MVRASLALQKRLQGGQQITRKSTDYKEVNRLGVNGLQGGQRITRRPMNYKEVNGLKGVNGLGVNGLEGVNGLQRGQHTTALNLNYMLNAVTELDNRTPTVLQ